MGHSVTGQLMQIRRPKLSKVKLRGLAEEVRQKLQSMTQETASERLRLLFVGAGQGEKNLAAEMLADGLDKDLALVDVTAVISKYIGETERNLTTLLHGIEQNQPLVLLDFVDALFENRSELLDGDEDYVRQMIDHLLERLENYPGGIVLPVDQPDRLPATARGEFRTIVDFSSGRGGKGGWWRKVIPWPK